MFAPVIGAAYTMTTKREAHWSEQTKVQNTEKGMYVGLKQPRGDGHIVNPLLSKLVRVKMTGYWPWEFMDLDSVSVYKHAKNEIVRYPAILTSHLVNTHQISPANLVHLRVKIILKYQLENEVSQAIVNTFVLRYVQDRTLMRFKLLMISITNCPHW